MHGRSAMSIDHFHDLTTFFTAVQAVKLVYEGTREVLVPVKQVSKDENIAYMARLYARCQVNCLAGVNSWRTLTYR